MRRPASASLLATSIAFLLAASVLPLSAATRQWDPTKTTGSWGVGGAGGNWTSAAAPTAADIAAFANITALTTVTLDADRTITRINVTNANSADVIIDNGTGGPWKITLADAATPIINLTNSRVLTINAIVAGTQGLSKTGNGDLILTNAGNTLTGGISVSAGVLNFVNGALGTNVVSLTGGALTWASGNTQDISSQLLLGDGASSTLNPSAATTLSTALQTGPLGTGKLVKGQGTTLTITGQNTYTGGTRINNGSIVLTGGDNRLSVNGAIELGSVNGTNSGTLTLGSGANASNQTVISLIVNSGNTGAGNKVIGGASVISTLTVNSTVDSTFTGTLGGVTGNQGNLALSKTGSGTFTLAQPATGTVTNTYAGATNVSGGTLLVNNAISGTSGVTVSSGATLGGSGSITTGSGSFGIAVQSGASLAPGALLNATGTLTLALGTGQLDVSAAAGGTGWLKFELGTASDQIKLDTGTFNIGSLGLDLDDFIFSDSGGFGVGTYVLVDGNAPITGNLGANVSGTVLGYSATLGLADGGNDLVLNVTAAPEPSVGLSLSGGIALLLGFVRRRKTAVRIS